MIALSAWWGLGYAAVLVATVTHYWHILHRDPAVGLTGQILALVSTVLLWVGPIRRARLGHGWPLVSPADSATSIALLMLLLHQLWTLFSREIESGFAVGAIALILLSFGLGAQPPTMTTLPQPSTAVLASKLLTLSGGSLLALAASLSLTSLLRGQRLRAREPLDAGRRDTLQHVSEMLVRGALSCLAIGLAVDTWWLQKVGLGNANDAQQAGLALAWMVYYFALRLRVHPRWRGWPWAAILAAGFACILPILIDAPWLENTLPI